MTKPIKRVIISAVILAAAAAGLSLLIHEVYAGPTDSPKTADTDSTAFKVNGNEISISASAIKAAGIQDFEVKTADVPGTLTLSGRTDLDQERVTHVHAQFPGKVVRVGAPAKPLQLGDRVRGPEEKGGPDTLCTIESTDLANAKANYLQAEVQLHLDEENLARTRELLQKQILAEKYLLDAQSAVTKDRAVQDAARQQLLVFGLTDADIQHISSQQGKERMTYSLTSPRSGMIVEKGVVGGELADPALNLFTVADTSTLWVWGDVYERDRPRVKEGQKMKVILTSDPDHPRDCTVKWISPVIDAATRSIKIRGELDNRDGHLLAQMYATLVVTVDEGAASIIVPADAVLRKGPDSYVLVRTASDATAATYRKTRVKVAPISAGPGLETIPPVGREELTHTDGPGLDGQRLRVIDGLAPGQTIVQQGALGLFNEIEQQQSHG